MGSGWGGRGKGERRASRGWGVGGLPTSRTRARPDARGGSPAAARREEQARRAESRVARSRRNSPRWLGSSLARGTTRSPARAAARRARSARHARRPPAENARRTATEGAQERRSFAVVGGPRAARERAPPRGRPRLSRNEPSARRAVRGARRGRDRTSRRVPCRARDPRQSSPVTFDGPAGAFTYSPSRPNGARCDARQASPVAAPTPNRRRQNCFLGRYQLPRQCATENVVDARGR